ncbi:MAG: prepilin-type cleavage/methylation domain-containing protein [Deltaproteobacteria bacterium]|nr:prepilin-type cleavage/methylation domain-containing protein [Deltaproteobacteria bacterium]
MSKFIRKSKKGFTLIELMIVVAIIGILAAIAIPNFMRFQLKSKSSEGKVNIAAIRTAQESYLAEFGSYVAAAANPAAVPGTSKGAFDLTAADFNTLGWAPEGQVFFQYEVNVSGSAYTITAAADIDGNATNQVWGYVKPVTGTTAGITPLSHGICLAGGIMNGSQLSTVGPCLAAHGQSIF